MLRTFYACNRCKSIYHHPIVNCFRCPGAMKQVKLNFTANSKGYFDGPDGDKQCREWLKSEGYNPWD